MGTLEDILNCPCKRFEPMTDAAPIMEAYREARARGAREGFTPILLPAGDERFSEMFTWEGNNPPEQYRQELLAQPLEDGAAYLARRLKEYREDYEAEGFSWPGDEPGEMAGGEASDTFAGIFDYGRPRKTVPLILAEIPVKNPWEVFAWIPFGGWNECPAPEEQMVMAKYWYEKYGAVPAVITMDVLEYSLPAPVKREEAMALAQEQYVFCMDIVDQGCESVGLLADILSKSTTWFFWWD